MCIERVMETCRQKHTHHTIVIMGAHCQLLWFLGTTSIPGIWEGVIARGGEVRCWQRMLFIWQFTSIWTTNNTQVLADTRRWSHCVIRNMCGACGLRLASLQRRRFSPFPHIIYILYLSTQTHAIGRCWANMIRSASSLRYQQINSW